MIFQIMGKCSMTIGMCLVLLALVGGASQAYGIGCNDANCNTNTCAGKRMPGCAVWVCTTTDWLTCMGCTCGSSLEISGPAWCVCLP